MAELLLGVVLYNERRLTNPPIVNFVYHKRSRISQFLVFRLRFAVFCIFYIVTFCSNVWPPMAEKQ